MIIKRYAAKWKQKISFKMTLPNETLHVSSITLLVITCCEDDEERRGERDREKERESIYCVCGSRERSLLNGSTL